ncbi:MAG: RiPP maturation radical SAM C-methyltransferase [Gammaproteobacteria bacterium]|nr:RiPP maturation radical SAM C-methyltransferase [Gammaproteobacteria bacterium]
MQHSDIVLVSMPWGSIKYPSIQLGILKSLCDREGIAAAAMSLNLDFFEFLAARAPAERLSADEYDFLGEASGLGLGEWIFTRPGDEAGGQSRDEAYGDYVLGRGADPAVLAKSVRLRALVPEFIEGCADGILAREPRVVGFTSTFCQTAPSLALARRLKDRVPGLRIVLGGANCEGPMGAALHRLYPWIDVIVRGEGERVVPPLFRELIGGHPVTRQPGLCIHDEQGSVVVDERHDGGIDLEQSPLPDYDEYFSRMKRSAVLAKVGVAGITYESARGCWWGAKHHCTFCGLNGATMAFRSKSAERVLDEVQALSQRYRKLDFIVVDNIIDMRHVRELVPKIRELDVDYSFYYETKVNLKKRELREMSEAGIRKMQPGIESLSTTVLKLMRKGTTALQNIRFLKWCAQFDVIPDWNLLYGFPGEPEEDYEHTARLIPALTHLTPPCSMHPLCMNRFSPYHKSAREFGLRIEGPARWYGFVHDADRETLTDIAYFFDFSYDDGRRPEQYTRSCRRAVEMWQEVAEQSYRQLYFSRGPGFIQVTDKRANFPEGAYVFDGVAAETYLACERGATPERILERLSPQFRTSVSVRDVRGFLDQMVERGLVYVEDDHYLSLALPKRRLGNEDGLDDSDAEPREREIAPSRAAARVA